MIAHADQEKVVNDADLAAIVARVIGVAPKEDRKPQATPTLQDFGSTPAEVGYGHGV